MYNSTWCVGLLPTYNRTRTHRAYFTCYRCLTRLRSWLRTRLRTSLRTWRTWRMNRLRNTLTAYFSSLRCSTRLRVCFTRCLRRILWRYKPLFFWRISTVSRNTCCSNFILLKLERIWISRNCKYSWRC
jgi:hypothetical protein